MIDKNDVFKMGDLIRNAEKSLDKLHKFAHRMSVKYKNEWNADEGAGDFQTLSGGTNKPPQPGGD